MSSASTSPDSQTPVRRTGLWAFWAAAALAAAGVIAPFFLGGGSSRLGGALTSLAVAGVAFGACALVYRRGKLIVTALYFVGSLAVVYGILHALAVPLRIAMLGACPADSGPCLPGLERPITTEESTALGLVVGIGIVAVLVGFYGLRPLYHRHRLQVFPAAPPPVRRIPPVAAKPPAETTPVPSPAPAKSSEGSVAVTEAPAEPEPQAELPAHEPDPELPAHVSEVTPEPSHAGPMPAPQRQHRRSKPKAPPEPPTSTNTE